MSCLEHWCVLCSWMEFDNHRHTCCPTHGEEASRHTWDEQYSCRYDDRESPEDEEMDDWDDEDDDAT
jgi:hypothetical protein